MPKRSTKRPKNNATYDTSILYEILKQNPKTFNSTIDSLGFDDKFCLYYSLIELNMGLVKTFVSYFELVEKYGDKAKAEAKASDFFGRGTKDTLILQSLITRLNEVSDNRNIESYLDQIEAAIKHAYIMIESSVKAFMGEFADHPLSKFHAWDREDYPAFMNLTTDYKVVDIANYLESLKLELTSVRDYIDAELNNHNTKKLKELRVIIDRAVKTPDLCNMYKLNRKYGDTLIALNTSSNHTLITTDWSFDMLSAGLGKEHIKIKFN